MHRLLILTMVLAGTLSAQQVPAKVHNSVPFRLARLGGGTVKTMVWPRHRWKEWAFLDANFLANGWDARSTMMVLSECVGCQESNPVLGPHPGAGADWSFKLGSAFIENMMTHALANKAREEHVPVVLTFIPASILGGLSVYAGDYNYFNGGYLLWRDCNRNPACFPHHQ